MKKTWIVCSTLSGVPRHKKDFGRNEVEEEEEEGEMRTPQSIVSRERRFGVR